MTTSAQFAHGTKLYRGGTGTPKTGGQLIEECHVVEPPEQTATEIDATSHDSSSTEAILSSCVDNGEVNLEFHWTAATGQELLRGDLGGSATTYYINYAGGSGQKQLEFSGLCKSFKTSAGRTDGLGGTATLRITGDVTWNTQS